MDPYLNKMIDNRYEIESLIGVGGMSRVYKALDHRLNRLVAFKILKEELAKDSSIRKKFFEESQAVAMLQHPNIVNVYDVNHSADMDYIVMEYVDGITLKQYMDRKNGKLDPQEACYFMIQILSALGHAHNRGIIHRDVKPQNILVLPNGVVKVADFGIAQITFGKQSTMTSEALGSVHYISPEQARGSHIDARSDIYSCGVVLYEMLTGKLPFEGDSPVAVAIQHINSIPLEPRDIDPNIPEALERITMKAMNPEPAKRYPTAADMIADLEAFQENPDVFLPQESPDSEVADEPTQFLGAVPVSSAVAKNNFSGNGTNDNYAFQSGQRPVNETPYTRPTKQGKKRNGKKKSNLPVIIAACAVVALIVGIIIFLLHSYNSVSSSSETLYTVPSVTGYTLDDLNNNPDLLDGFTIQQGAVIENNDYAEGTILSQSPEEGEKVDADHLVITVTVSTKSEEITMPDVSNMLYDQAKTLLENMGLTVSDPVYQYSDDYEEGYVISSSPEAGSTLTSGDTVVLTVSQGAKVTTVTVPNVINDTQETAERILMSFNLIPGNITTEYSDEVMKGCVISQTPAADSVVNEGTTIDLVISLGPEPTSSSTDSGSSSSSDSSAASEESSSSATDETENTDGGNG